LKTWPTAVSVSRHRARPTGHAAITAIDTRTIQKLMGHIRSGTTALYCGMTEKIMSSPVVSRFGRSEGMRECRF
jgi:hypothetical protein